MFLNDKPCMVRPTLLDVSPVELKYDPFMISLNKCTGNCNVLFSKIYVPEKTKDINFKAFNMVANKNGAKAHISCDCKCKFTSKTSNSKQKWNRKTC